MSKCKLYRSVNNRMIGGVCGGIGELTGISPTLIRVLFVLGGVSIIIYIILCLVLPSGENF